MINSNIYFIFLQGDILEEFDNEIETRTIFLFNDMLVCATPSRLSAKMKLVWTVKLINCHIAFIEPENEDPRIEIAELTLLTENPFLEEQRWILRASDPPYDFQFWKTSFQGDMETYQWEQDRLLVENSAFIAEHMMKHLIGERERTMLQIGTTKSSFAKGENVSSIDDAADSCFIVNHGKIRIEKLLSGEWVTVGYLGK